MLPVKGLSRVPRRGRAVAAVLSLTLLVSCAPSRTPDPFAGPSGAASAVPSPGVSSPAAKSAVPSAAPTDPPTGWGPSTSHLTRAQGAVAAMTTEQKAGQVLVGEYSSPNSGQMAELIKELNLAGTILMGGNVPQRDGGVDLGQLAAETGGMARAFAETGRDWAPVVAVDQEGGLVTRVGHPATEWPAPMSYGAANSPEVALGGSRAMAQELAALGFTMDFAPVADLTVGAPDPTVGTRALAGRPEVASAVMPGAVAGFLEAGVLPSLKHFPGHGSVTQDSHVDLPVLGASVDELRAKDWQPFAAGVRAGAPMVMMGHLDVPALEPGVPTSLSPKAYQALRELGFQGVAVTDALNMAAVVKGAAPGEEAVRALAAGADLLLMPQDLRTAHRAIVAAVASGRVAAQRLDEAATRVVAMMMWQKSITGPVDPTFPGSQWPVSRAVSDAALTVVVGKCQQRHLEGTVRILGGSPQDRDRAEAAARRRGLELGGGPTLALDSGTGAPPADIVAVVDQPWMLGTNQAGTKIAMFGRTHDAFDALFAYLLGERTATGVLPVDLPGVDPGTRCEA